VRCGVVQCSAVQYSTVLSCVMHAVLCCHCSSRDCYYHLPFPPYPHRRFETTGRMGELVQEHPVKRMNDAASRMG
jgi:hypothetical protein